MDHTITSMRMEENLSRMAEKILNLTLEIIYLLTGESFPPMKSDDHLTITVPSPHSLKPKGNNEKKILEITNKIIDLLTGEEWEYLKGHKVLYKDVMMEDQPPLTSPDGSSNGNPPESCPLPLYSRDSTQEDQEIPQDYEGEDLIVIKVEPIDDEEIYITSDEPCKEEEIPPEIRTDGRYSGGTIEEHLIIKQVRKTEDDDVSTSSNLHSGLSSAHSTHGGRPPDDPRPSESEDSVTQPDELIPVQITDGVTRLFSCSECGKRFKQKADVVKHQRLHSGERPYSCSVCGKSFSGKSNLIRHEITHTGQKPYSCSDCGKQFAQKSHLVTHEKLHAGYRPFSCSTCGKSFTDKAVLVRHEKSHSEEKPYSCSECGKSFKQRSDVVKHERIHSGVKPYSCTDCGKSFVQKAHLLSHQKVHVRDNPE